jgi:hypothetical protein
LWLAEGESRIRGEGPGCREGILCRRSARRGHGQWQAGLKPDYHANYYGGFVKDPDGNNIEAVCHQEE